MRILSEITTTLLLYMKNTRFTPHFFLIGFIILLSLSAFSYADEIALIPNPPEKYTVMKGDTLWDISSKFLKNPWQWKELWKNNTQIQNPHLIYPNDTIYFNFINGTPQFNLSRPANLQSDKTCILKPSDYEKGRQTFLLDKNNKVLPCVRESEIEKPINLIPYDKIAKFLTSPKIVSEEELNNAAYVIGFQNDHLMAGKSDNIYVKNVTEIANSYTIYRAGETYRNVDTNELLGIEAKYIASATRLNNDGDDIVKLTITKSAAEIRIGDRVMPNHEIENTLNFFPNPPEKMVNGHIIGIQNGMAFGGLYDVVVINKGSDDGLIVGHELTIYQKGKHIVNTINNTDEIDLPDEISGKIMVFRPFEHLSYALVMQTNHDIHRLYKVKTN